MLWLTLLSLFITTPMASADLTVPDTLLSFIDTTTETKIKESSGYLKATYLQHGGKYHEALKAYHDLFTQEASPYIYEGYLRLLSETNQFDAIVGLIDKTHEMFEDDLEMQLIYAQSLLNTNRDTQAEELLQKLKEKYPDNEQIIFYLAAHREKTNNFKKALEEIDTFLTKTPRQSKLFLFYFLKAKIHLKMNDHTSALAAIEKSLRLFPKFDKGILFKALLLEQTGKFDAAIACYRRYIKIAGKDPAIQKQIIQLLFSQKQFTQAVIELKKIKSEKSEYFFDLALLEWKAEKFQQALANINIALKKNPYFMKAKLLKIEILLALKQFTPILQILEAWLIKTPHDNAVIHTLLLLRKTDVPLQGILNVLEKAHEKHKKHHNILLALADLYLETKQHPKALDSYKKVLSLTKNEELKAKINFQIGFIYFAMNNEQESISVLEKAICEKIVYPSSYNLLAYCYAHQEKSLDKALELVDKALDHDVESPYSLDTKGWILYKQGKYTQAITTLEKAQKYAPNDETIQQHIYDAKTKLSSTNLSGRR